MPYRDLDDAIALANRGMGSLALSLFTHSPDDRARLHRRRSGLSRPDAGHRPHQCGGIDRPRLAAPGPDPRRPRPGRRRRGDGRRPRGQALHAADRDPVLAGDDRGDHRRLHRRLAQASGRRPPVPQADERTHHRRHAQDQEPHGIDRRHRAFRRASPATISTPTWTRKPRKPRRSSKAGSLTAI